LDHFNFDAAYLVRLRDRDPGTLDHFCDYFHMRLRSYAVHNLPSGMANDFVQDLFVTVLTRVDAGEPQDPCKLPAYVYGIARMLALQGYRTINKNRVADIDPSLFPDLQDRADIRMIRELNAGLVRRLIGRLSARDRAAIERVFFREQDRPTAAREMGISQECLRTILCRALKRFRREWDNIQE
jgi:RNA polymerase sigma-70 factor (ECF subfamily)